MKKCLCFYVLEFISSVIRFPVHRGIPMVYCSPPCTHTHTHNYASKTETYKEMKWATAETKSTPLGDVFITHTRTHWLHSPPISLPAPFVSSATVLSFHAGNQRFHTELGDDTAPHTEGEKKKPNSDGKETKSKCDGETWQCVKSYILRQQGFESSTLLTGTVAWGKPQLLYAEMYYYNRCCEYFSRMISFSQVFINLWMWANSTYLTQLTQTQN